MPDEVLVAIAKGLEDFARILRSEDPPSGATMIGQPGQAPTQMHPRSRDLDAVVRGLRETADELEKILRGYGDKGIVR